MRQQLATLVTAVAVSGLVTPAHGQTTGDAPTSGNPIAIVDLRTEDGARLVQGQWRFRDVKITIWDFPAFDLKDRATVRDYLYSWYYPALTLEEAERRSQLVDVPLKLSKRGAWGVGRKPR